METPFSAVNHNGTEDLTINLPSQSVASLKYRFKVEKDWIYHRRCPAPRGLNILNIHMSTVVNPHKG